MRLSTGLANLVPVYGGGIRPSANQPDDVSAHIPASLLRNATLATICHITCLRIIFLFPAGLKLLFDDLIRLPTQAYVLRTETITYLGFALGFAWNSFLFLIPIFSWLPSSLPALDYALYHWPWTCDNRHRVNLLLWIRTSSFGCSSPESW